MLAEFVQAINDLFDGEITRADAVTFTATMKSKMMKSAVLRAHAAAISQEQFRSFPKPQDERMQAVVSVMGGYQLISR